MWSKAKVAEDFRRFRHWDHDGTFHVTETILENTTTGSESKSLFLVMGKSCLKVRLCAVGLDNAAWGSFRMVVLGRRVRYRRLSMFI